MNKEFNDLTVVIPTLNEAEAIGKVLNEVLSIGIPKENIMVVDGGSTDDTIEIVKSKRIRIIIQEGRGKADAIKTAIKYVKTPYVLFMDGDYTYPAKYIPELYRKIKQGYDLVIGARRYAKNVQPLVYRLGNKILTKFFNTLFGVGLHDVLSGMYIIKTEVLKELMFETRNFGIESEIVAHVISTTRNVAEIPIEYRQRLGKKKLRVKHGFEILREMIRLAWRYNPTFLIFILGSLMLIPGLILCGYVIFMMILYGVKHYVKGLIGVMLTLSGFQSLLLALLSLYLKRFEYRIMRRLTR
jgi:dolichol-phosphate mannosyltransferase